MKTVKVYKLDNKTQLKVKSDGSVRFCYETCSDRAFEFSLYCEVGEPYKAGFDAIIQHFGLKFGSQMEFDVEPWIADTVVPI